jgi:lysophospholipase L1-like esterase
MHPRRSLLPLLALVLVAVAALSTLPLRAATPPAHLAVAPGDIYLALGDSLATGTEAAANDDGQPGYPAFLSDRIKVTTPITSTLLGESGATTVGMLAAGGQLDQATTYIAERRQAGERVGLITLSVGGNDIVNVLRGNGSTITSTLTVVRNNLGLILDELIAASSVDGRRQAEILVLNYYNAYPGVTITDLPPFVDLPPDQEPIVTDRDLPKFNQVLLEVALSRCVAVVDAFSVIRGAEATYLFVKNPLPQFPTEADLDYHPREAGHRALAAAALARLEQPQCQRLYLPQARR